MRQQHQDQMAQLVLLALALAVVAVEQALVVTVAMAAFRAAEQVVVVAQELALQALAALAVQGFVVSTLGKVKI